MSNSYMSAVKLWYNFVLSAFSRWIAFNQRAIYWPFKVVMLAVPHRVDVQLTAAELRPGVRYIVAGNHQSRIDPFVISAEFPLALWRHLRPFRYMAYHRLFAVPVLREMLLNLGAFPTKMYAHYAYGINAAQNFLRAGHTVMIFPEGQRTRPGLSARPGIAVLASEPQAMVIPVHLEWQRHGRWRRSYRMTIGHPFDGHSLSANQVLQRVYDLPLPSAHPGAVFDSD